MTESRTLFIASDAVALALEAAGCLVTLISEAIKARGVAHLGLSGGSTPTRLYRRLASAPFAKAIDWSRVHLYFADERFVPHDDPESTTRLVRETLLSGIDLPPDHFHPMPTLGDPDECAQRYAETLRSQLESETQGLDLVLLGMGPDGHTASLFPGLPEALGAVAAVRHAPKPPPTRLTLTKETLSRSGAVWFLVTGADKAAPLKTVFSTHPGNPDPLPAACITARDGTSLWLTDPEAAALLTQPPA